MLLIIKTIDKDASSLPSKFPLNIWSRRNLQRLLRATITDWIIALFLYTVITLVFTFPLIFHLSNSIAGPDGGGDDAWYVWLLWWFKQALATGQDPAHTNLIFGLVPPAQNFSPTFVNELLGWFFQLLVRPLTAYNLLILLGFILSGLTMYVLVREFILNKIVCFTTGFLYTFSTYHFTRAKGHLELFTIQWIPFLIWRTFIFYRQPNLKNAVLLGLSMALVACSALYYVPFFLLPFGVLFIIGRFIVDRQWFKRRRNWLLSAVALVFAFAISIMPLLGFVIVDLDMQKTLKQEGASGIEVWSADLTSFIFPSPENPYIGSITRQFNLNIIFESYMFLGYVGLGLSLGAFAFYRNRRKLTYFWLGLGVLGILLAAGPVFSFGIYSHNQSLFSVSPYNLAFGSSIFSGFRVPARLGIIPLIASTILAAFGLDAIFTFIRFKQIWIRKIAQVGLVVVLAAGQLVGSVVYALPYPTSPLLVPTVYQQIANDKDNALVLELPIRAGGLYEYYQTFHHKALAGGYLARITDTMWNSLEAIPYLSQFTPVNKQPSQPETKQTDIYPLSISLRAGLWSKHIKYVLLHPLLDRDNYQRFYDTLTANLGTPFYQNTSEDVVAWQVTPTLPNPDISRIELGTGWIPVRLFNSNGKTERIVGTNGSLNIYAPVESEQLLNFDSYAMLKPQTLEVRLNGTTLTRFQFTTPGVVQNFQLPLKLKAGQNKLEFQAASGCVSPHDFDSNSNDLRCLSFGIQNVRLSNLNLVQDPILPSVQAGSNVISPYYVKLGTGWLDGVTQDNGQIVRVVSQAGQLHINAPDAQLLTLSLSALALFKPQTLEMRLNGALLTTIHFDKPSVLQPIQVPVQLKAGDNLVEFNSVEGCSAPHDYNAANPDTRCFAFSIQQLKLSYTAQNGQVSSVDLEASPIGLDTGWLPSQQAASFGVPERIMNQDGRLVISSITDQQQSLTFKIHPFFRPLTMQIWLNGTLSKVIRLDKTDTLTNVEVPLQLKAGQNVVEIASLEGCMSPQDLDSKNSDTRCMSFGVQEVQLTKFPAKN